MIQAAKPAPSASYRRPRRLARLIRRIENSRPCLFIDRALYFTESMRRTEGMSLPLRWAKALTHTLEHIPIELVPDDLLAGKFGPGRCGIFYPELDGMFLAGGEGTPEQFVLSAADRSVVQRKILPYWRGRTYQENVYAHLPETLKTLLYIDGNPAHPAFIVQESATVRHSLQWALDYGKVLRLGFRGIAREAEERKTLACKKDQKDFYEAVVGLCRGIRTFAGRFAALAEGQAPRARSEERRQELLDLAERCRRVPWEPAAGFVDAVQAQWFTQLVSRLEGEYGGHISNGRMDQYLYPFYRRDVESGRLTEQIAREYLDALWCGMAQFVRLKPSPTGAKIYEDFAHWEFTTIGGQLDGGQDATNELSFLILRSATDFPLDYPYLGVRIHPGSPQNFLEEIGAATQAKGKSPVLLNDRTIITRQIRNGASPAEAFDYCGTGFSEVRLINRDTYLPGASWLNLPAVLEMALMDGFCTPSPARRLGLSTGGAERFGAFTQLMDAFERQLSHMLDQTFRLQAVIERLRPAHIASPLLSCLHDLGMEHGRDISSGPVPGGRSIGGYIGIIGFATVIDSLAAVKTLVFDEKRLGLAELLRVLALNFEGHEELRQRCLNCPKYGERIAWVDAVGKRIDRLLLARSHREVNRYGGRGEIFYVPVKAHIAMGRVSGATPDGRFAGEKFSCGVAPSSPIPPLGPTVALASEAAAQNPEFCSLGARVMVSRLLPQQICGRTGIDTLLSVMETWCRQDHWFLQFQILSPAELRVLKNSPADYGNVPFQASGLNTRGYAFPSAAFSRRCPVQNLPDIPDGHDAEEIPAL